MSNAETAVTKPSANGAAQPPQRVFKPRTDVVETPEAVLVYADMPGVDEASLDITLEKNTLTVRGKSAAPAWSGHALNYAEYDVGDYERSFTIGGEIDRDTISASVKNGVLKLSLPKAQALKARKIAVKSE